jgi:pyruvate-formate lyase-activating enzyme
MPLESGYRVAPGNEAAAVEPSSEELAAVVLSMCDAHESGVHAAGPEAAPAVSFAGRGEPLLRLETLCDTVRRVHARRPGVSFRVNTNGLFDSSLATMLADAGVKKATVALASADEALYDELMQPMCLPGELQPRGLRDVLAFISRLSECGVAVEAGIVAHPAVDVEATRRLAQTVGASDIRVRTYFP